MAVQCLNIAWRVVAVGLAAAALFAFPSVAHAWTVSSASEGWAVRIQRDHDDTGTATAYLYGATTIPTAAQLASSWDTTGAGTWMGSTLRATIGFDTTDDAFEFYASSMSPQLIYILAVIDDSQGRREQEVVTLGAWNVQPVYLANKPSASNQPSLTVLPVSVVNTVATTSDSTVTGSGNASPSVLGTLPVTVESIGSLDASGVGVLASAGALLLGVGLAKGMKLKW